MMRLSLGNSVLTQAAVRYSRFRPRRWQPAPELPRMPATYAAFYQAALRSRHRFFASGAARRYHAPLARNRAIWSARRWLKAYREGERTREVMAAIADCMAIIEVLSGRS